MFQDIEVAHPPIFDETAGVAEPGQTIKRDLMRGAYG